MTPFVFKTAARKDGFLGPSPFLRLDQFLQLAPFHAQVFASVRSAPRLPLQVSPPRNVSLPGRGAVACVPSCCRCLAEQMLRTCLCVHARAHVTWVLSHP